MQYSHCSTGTRITAAAVAFAALLSAGSAHGANTQLRVTTSRVNLRCKPGLGGEVVYVASRGELLTAVKGAGEEWVQVLAPKGATLYVYAELVRNGVVAVPTLQARSRDGIDHQTVCVLRRGDKVAGRGRAGDWLKIAPPRGCTLWVAGKYVAPPEPPKKKPAPKPKPKQKPVVAVRPPPKPVTPPKPPKPSKPATDFRRGTAWKAPIHTTAPARRAGTAGAVFASEELVRSREQGVAAIYTGTLRRSGPVFRRPSAYCIMDRDGRGRGFTQCYILGSDRQLAGLLGRKMRIEGSEYWLQGVRHPVVVPKRIYRRN